MQRKSSNFSPKDKQQGFKKSAPAGRPAFKKKFNGPKREDSSESGSERSTDGKRSYSERGHSFDKNKKWDTDKTRKRFNDAEGRTPDRTDRPRSFDKNKKWDTDKPRKRFNDAEGGTPDRADRPRSFDKKKNWETDKPRKRFNDAEGAGTHDRADRPRSFDKKKNWEADKPRKRYNDAEGERGSRNAGEERKFDKRKEWGTDKPRRDDNHTGDEHGKRGPATGSFEKKKWGGDKPRKEDSRPFRQRPQPFDRKAGTAKPHDDTDKKKKEEKPAFDKLLSGAFDPEKKKKDEFSKPVKHEDKVYGALEDVDKTNVPVRPFKAKKKSEEEVPRVKKQDGKRKKKYYDEDEEEEVKEEAMPLNKYIAHSGECSRRDAAELVKQGKVKVNGELVLDPGYKVKDDDQVTLVGKKLKPTKNNVYILLNKPKGYITTNDDPQGRRTVMELVQGAGVDRLFPVGRLDRDTSGLLLITNDGDLTQKLSHPSHEIKKVYQVTLDKPLTKADFEKVINGVELEDGKAIVDELAYLETKNELGLEIHSGRNRIVRRIFESLGYVVEKLDRMMYAGLTKKNLPRGKWRFLDPREIVLLKHFKN